MLFVFLLSGRLTRSGELFPGKLSATARVFLKSIDFVFKKSQTRCLISRQIEIEINLARRSTILLTVTHSLYSCAGRLHQTRRIPGGEAHGDHGRRLQSDSAQDTTRQGRGPVDGFEKAGRVGAARHTVQFDGLGDRGPEQQSG